MAIPASLNQRNSLALGFTPMDDIHVEFDMLIAQALSCPDANLLCQIELLKAHLYSHFGAEDSWMRETNFPAQDCHINEHAAVLQSAEDVYQLVSQGNLSIGRSFVSELQAWFPGHADYLDSALAHWMCKRRLGGKPIVLHSRTPVITMVD